MKIEDEYSGQEYTVDSEVNCIIISLSLGAGDVSSDSNSCSNDTDADWS
mgnify:FL=1